MQRPADPNTHQSAPAALRRAPVPLVCAALLLAASGCLSSGHPLTSRERAIAAGAGPILRMDPDAVWTDGYNRLVELGTDSIAYLMRQPAMTQAAAPDDLRVLLHTSLVRLLADPTTAPPRLSASCLETTLGVLHFDLKVRGRRVGTIVLPEAAAPRAWHELYPADFDHALAAAIDVEADRRALRTWWRAHRNHSGTPTTARRLEPRPNYLWRLLARRYADRWEYQPEPRAVLCVASSRGPALFRIATHDYNVVRAACIWLGSSSEPDVQEGLIELVGSPSPVVAHNARFALGYSPDERIRAVVRRYEAGIPPGAREKR